MTQSKKPKFTDHAADMIKLIGIIKGSSSRNGVFFSELSKHIGIQNDDAFFVSIINQIIRRIDETIEMVSKFDEDDISTEASSIAISNLRLFRNIFGFSMLNSPIQNAVNNIPADLETTLKFLSAPFRKARPLLILDDEAKANIIQNLEHVISDFHNNSEMNEIPDWVRGPLIFGLKDLCLSLRYIDFMGHEYVLEKLASVYNRTLQSEGIMKSEDCSKSSIQKVRDILITIILIGDLFALPVNMIDAGKKYYGSLTYYIPFSHEKSQKLLPKPSEEDIEVRNT